MRRIPDVGKPVAVSAHAWLFPRHFRARAFGWKGTKLAAQRLKEALTEIKLVQRTDPALAAEGAVRLIEKIVPAIQDIDGSSGAIGTAVDHALTAAVEVIAAAPASPKERQQWLDRLWQAHEEDGYGYLDRLPERWGSLCGPVDIASAWADQLLPTARHAARENVHFRGTTAALSCLLTAGRYEELLDLASLPRTKLWFHQAFTVQAYVAMGCPEDALRYAETEAHPDDQPQAAEACERILRDLGRVEEAYNRYGRRRPRSSTNLATYRALAKAYPEIPASKLLADLVASNPGEEGKWFATAKQLELFEEAIELANRSPCDPKTLIRAARDHEATHPGFAAAAGITALRWLCAGHGYDLVGTEPYQAFDLAMRAGERAGKPTETLEALRALIADPRTRNWAGDALARLLGSSERGNPLSRQA